MANTLDIHDLRYVNIIRDFKKRPRLNYVGEVIGFYYTLKLRVMRTITYESSGNAGYVKRGEMFWHIDHDGIVKNGDGT